MKWAYLEQGQLQFIDFIPFNAASGGFDTDEKRKTELLRQLKLRFQKYNIAPKTAILTLSDKSIFNRTLDIIPPENEEELINIFKTFIETSVPFFSQDRQIAYQLLGQKGEKSCYFVSSVPKNVLNFYQDLFQALEIQMEFGIVDALSTLAFYQEIYQGFHEPSAMIYFGSGKTEVNILAGDQLLFTRNLQLGDAYINQTIADALKVTPEKAKELKIKYFDLIHSTKILEFEEEQIIRAIKEAMHMIIKDLRRTFDFYLNYHPNRAIQKIYLSGASSHLNGFKDYLAFKMGLPVEYFWNQNHATLKTSIEKIKKEKINIWDGDRLVHLQGLIFLMKALKTKPKAEVTANLFRHQTKKKTSMKQIPFFKKEHQQKLFLNLKWVLAGITIILMALLLATFFKFFWHQSQIQKLSKEFAVLKPRVEQVEKQMDELRQINNALSLNHLSAVSHARLLNIFKLIEGVQLESFDLQHPRLVLVANTDNQQSLSRVISRLEQSPMCKKVVLEYSKSAHRGLSFKINIELS